MARRLSALLGLLAGAAAPVVASSRGASGIELLWSTGPHLLSFAAVGYLFGLIADWAIETSVRERMQAAAEALAAERETNDANEQEARR